MSVCQERADSHLMNKRKQTHQNELRLLTQDGPDEIRTHDPYNANVVRSQLRYKPIRLQQNQSSTK